MAQHLRFESLLDNHRGILYKVSRSYSRTPQDRDDLAQEIVVQLWKSFRSWNEDRARFSTWMYRVALNVAISYCRRETVRAKHLVPILDIPAKIDPTDEADLLYGAIEKLDPLNRALILLYLDGHSYDEIAEILGITKTNVATKINRLKTAFKKELTGDIHGTR